MGKDLLDIQYQFMTHGISYHLFLREKGEDEYVADEAEHQHDAVQDDEDDRVWKPAINNS